LAWSAFITYEVLLIGLRYGVFGHPLTYAAHYGIIIAYFYAVSDKALPWSLASKRLIIIRLPLAMVVLFCAYVLLNYAVDTILVANGIVKHLKKVVLDKNFILDDLYRSLYFTGFATAYYFLKTYFNEKKHTSFLEEQRLLGLIKEEKMAKTLAKAQNDFLRAQINPHFLFNTLNYVYNNINRNPQQARDAVITLSDIMRFAIDSGEDELIALGEEMHQVRQLRDLHQARMDFRDFIDIYIDEDAVDVRFVPLVLLSLMENIFKHGHLSVAEHPALLAVYMDENKLHIHSDNLVDTSGKKDGTHNGIKNIHSRLIAAYGDAVDFSYGLNPEGHYIVSIVIPLHHIHTYIRETDLQKPEQTEMSS
jgi:sensor histidine kinase YesM